MINFDDIAYHYNFSEQDKENLLKLKDIANDYSDRFINEFYDYLNLFKDKDKYLSTDKIKENHKNYLKNWFLSLFEGKYDNVYLNKLYDIGKTHRRINLPNHYVNAAINFVRVFCEKMIIENFHENDTQMKLLESVNKILDINLDIITESYKEREPYNYLSFPKTLKVFISFIGKITYMIDVFIVSILALLSILGGVWVVYKLWEIIIHVEDPERNALEILGAVLLLYALTELLAEEIKHLKGANISIKVFAGVALAAVIRKLLIISLYPQKYIEIGVISFMLLSIAIVYYLISKVEKR